MTALESLGLSSRDQFILDPASCYGRVVIMHGASANVIWQEPDGTEGSGLCSLAKGLAKTPVAGDWVVVKERRILDVMTRRSELRRPHPYGRDPQVMAANVDVVMIVIAVNLDLNQRLLERLSMMALDSGATPMVIVTKMDEAEDAEGFCVQVREQIPDVMVMLTSSLTGEGIDDVRAQLPTGVTAVMLGASGVGKTSLLNALEGTEELTRSVNRGGEGRHATSTRKLYRLASGGVLLDIPGIRLPEVVADQHSLDQVFDDIDELTLQCRFRNCHHDSDDGCAVRAAVESGALAESRFETWRAVHAAAASADVEAPRDRRRARESSRGPTE
jgi:ribosome biogenesis GTPase